MAHRTIRYRIRGKSPKIYGQLNGTAGACRFVWNWAVGQLKRDEREFNDEYWEILGAWCLANALSNKPAPTEKDEKSLKTELRKAYKAQGKCDFSFFSLGKKFTDLRNKEETAWLKEYPMTTVRQSLKPIGVTYKKFFNGGGGLPKFKAKYRSEPSFPLATDKFTVEKERLRIERIGWMEINGNNPYEGCKTLSGTVKCERGKWFAYIVYEVPDDLVAIENTAAVGIDRNAGQITLSDERVFRMPKMTRLEARQRRYQRMVSRRKRTYDRVEAVGDNGKKYTRLVGKNSQRRERARQMLAKTSAKIARIRHNWAHQITRTIAETYGKSIVEDLNTASMTKSAKGTVEEPGKNVKAKAGLNRVILETSWYKIEQLLSYKTELIKVPAQYTSQRCSKCGHTDKDNRKTQEGFQCQQCGHRMNADCNAAINIRALGLGAIGHGAGDTSRAMKCQKATSFL